MGGRRAEISPLHQPRRAAPAQAGRVPAGHADLVAAALAVGAIAATGVPARQMPSDSVSPFTAAKTCPTLVPVHSSLIFSRR